MLSEKKCLSRETGKNNEETCQQPQKARMNGKKWEKYGNPNSKQDTGSNGVHQVFQEELQNIRPHSNAVADAALFAMYQTAETESGKRRHSVGVGVTTIAANSAKHITKCGIALAFFFPDC